MSGEPTIVQVVPGLGLSLDGVADYATELGLALARLTGIRSFFLCAKSQFAAEGFVAGTRYATVRSRSAAGLLETLRGFEQEPEARQVVLLHYVNYGYAERGCPYWLIRGIQEWRRSAPRARLVTMFHELYASGPPWRSSYWLSPVQRHLARELYSISDYSVTNRELSRQWLVGNRKPTETGVTVMPVFSTLGEPAKMTGWGQRSRRLVVAGRSGEPQRAYGRFQQRLIQACRELGIDEIVDIGARFSPVPVQVGGIRVTALGHLAQPEASTILAGARAGFLDYPSDYLGKSTVFAAYAAHGLVPVVSWRRGEEEAGLKEGANYWISDSATPAPGDFESIARRAHAWYTDHRLEVQARVYARLLSGDSV